MQEPLLSERDEPIRQKYHSFEGKAHLNLPEICEKMSNF